jgi:hypothetical protein
MDIVQQVCHFNNTPSSQTFRIYIQLTFANVKFCVLFEVQIEFLNVIYTSVLWIRQGLQPRHQTRYLSISPVTVLKASPFTPDMHFILRNSWIQQGTLRMLWTPLLVFVGWSFSFKDLIQSDMDEKRPTEWPCLCMCPHMLSSASVGIHETATIYLTVCNY